MIVYRLVVSLVLVLSYFLLPKYGFTSTSDISSHLLYPLSHANIWHLAANVLCLWMLRCPLHIVTTFVCAVLCSFLPSFSIYDGMEPTTGFSGVLFAMVGISWGRIHRMRDMLKRNWWILILPAFIPHVNFLIHIYCILAGYFCGAVFYSKESCYRQLRNL